MKKLDIKQKQNKKSFQKFKKVVEMNLEAAGASTATLFTVYQYQDVVS
jgi:hypothetical protein